MNNKRSYLDTLNAGRQRRPGTTLDQITQSLQNLEERLDRSREALDDFGRDRDNNRQPRTTPIYESGRPYRDAPAPAASPERQPRRAESQPSYQSLARDFDRVRGQEESVASASRIAGELKTLREELRQQMTANIQNEFETLRGDIGRMMGANNTAAIGSELATELDRISRAVHDLSERTDDKGMSALRGDIDQVRGALASLAREDTVRSSDRRWDEFDRRWTAFESRVDARQAMRDPEMTALSERLQTISDAVNNLPESLSLRSLEEKVRMLAGAVDHFVRQQDRQTPEMFQLIEERLDEISRAIVASAVAAQPVGLDPEPLERIEARMSALARQIEEVAEDRPSVEVINRLTVLTQRVDDMAAKGGVPQEALERLSRHVVAIADKIDRTPVAAERDAMLASIDQRFDVLSAMIERRQEDAIEHGNMMFRDMERRLDEVADRMDMRAAEPLETTRAMNAIDARLSDLAAQVANTPARASEAAVRKIEDRLESISARIDASAAKVSGIDPALIRSLENQVSALSEHLNRPSAPLPEFEDIGPRLDELERSIAGSRDSILEAARQAAENAVRTFDGSQTHTAAVTGLSQDLRALESLTRRSDERNTKTFEAIHDTLIKIVDRLGSLDDAEAPAEAPRAAAAMAPAMESRPTPPLQADHDVAEIPAVVKAARPVGANTRTPAEAAAAAAIAAIDADAAEHRDAAAKPRSLLGGITRALGRKTAPAVESKGQEKTEPTVVAEQKREPSLDEPLDPKIANRPLEPGSGAPDLNAIMRRVREERGQAAKAGESDAAKADFRLAAARRAAQAAAADAEVHKRGTGTAGAAGGSRIGTFLKTKRKPLLMAATAIMVVLTGLQLGSAYMSGDKPMAASSIPLVAEQPVQSTNGANAIQPTVSGPVIAGAGDTSMPASDADQAKAVGGADAMPTVEEPQEPMDATSEADVRSVDQAPAMSTDEAASATPAAPVAPDTETAVADPAPASSADKAPPVQISGIPEDAGPIALREAATAGDAKALFEIASRYADGRGIKADMKQAATWYEKSAELGFAPAQYRIGNLYEKALGVERDIGKAKTWYQLSAEQGNASAMHNLAVLYAMGADGTVDNESAVRWFTTAANLGVKDSQFNLGILAAQGVGMPQSLEESYKWFALAAKSGDRDAAGKRDEVANSLRPELLEKARGLVDLWKAKPLDPETNSVEIPESWQEATPTTASIDMKKAIGNIQRILNKNGYDAGGADGVMGDKTKKAIMAFQKDNGMAPNGEIDEPLVRALLAKK